LADFFPLGYLRSLRDVLYDTPGKLAYFIVAGQETGGISVV